MTTTLISLYLYLLIGFLFVFHAIREQQKYGMKPNVPEWVFWLTSFLSWVFWPFVFFSIIVGFFKRKNNG